jgi:ribosome recycling factor
MSDYKEFTDKMEKTCDYLVESFNAVRAGRANAAVLDRITIDYYGTETPIQQVATISTPDPRTLAIQPWTAACSNPSSAPSRPASWASTPRTTAA